MEFNIRNGLIRYQISNAMKVILEHFPLALTVCEIITFQISSLWKCRSRSWPTTLAVAPFIGKYPTSYAMAIVTFAISLIVYELFANQENAKTFTLQTKVKVNEYKKWTCAIRLEMPVSIWVIFCRILIYLRTCVYANTHNTIHTIQYNTITKYAKTHTHTNTHTHTHPHTVTQRETGVMT